MTRPHGAAVLVERLGKRYGDTVAVADVEFEVGVGVGEIFGVLGANGAGKTTTLECLEGLRESDAARARLEVLGVDVVAEPSVARRLLGVQLQVAGLPPTMRVGEVVRFLCEYRGVPPDTNSSSGSGCSARCTRRTRRCRAASSVASCWPSRWSTILRSLSRRAHQRFGRARASGAPPSDAGAAQHRDHDPARHPRHGRGRDAVRPCRHRAAGSGRGCGQSR